MKNKYQRTIEVISSNQREKTFTLKVTYPDGKTSKYRTCSFNKSEFEDMEQNTQADWENFLRTQDFYYPINK